MRQTTKSNVVAFDGGVERLLHIAYKKIDKNEFVNAIPILKKALIEDENNVDALLELATIYSKMNLISFSNMYAYRAMYAEHNEVSLFVIGNNFLKMHNYDMGLIYFKRLLEMYPKGEYADYVSMVIERVEDKSATGRELKLLRMTNKGKKYIEKEQYKKAIRLFSMLSTVVPEHVFIKNNLAMAHFYEGNHDKAIKICKNVLSTHRYDVHANCNLALFYFKQKNKYEFKRQQEKLAKLNPRTQEEYIKLVSTYCELKCHEEVVKTVKKAMLTYSEDITYMFFLAAAYYNLGKVNSALSVYHDIMKIDEDNYIAYYYIKSINSLMKPKKIDYYHQLPVVAIIDCAKRFKVLSEMSKDELLDEWNREDRLKVIWGTRYKDDYIKKMCFDILGTLANSESEEDLRTALFSTTISDDIKKEILANLGMMNAKQPYAAYFGGDILDVKVSVAKVENGKDLERPQKAIDIFQQCMAEDFNDELVKECVDMYVMILNKGIEKDFKSLNALCAVIEMSVRELFKLEYSSTELYKRYHTTAKTVDEYGNRLAELLMDSMGKASKAKLELANAIENIENNNKDNDGKE